MKIVFLNVWGAHMQASLTGYLAEQARDTDIFCFQEAAESMRRACADALSEYREISDFKYISEHEHFPQVIFVRKDSEVLSSGSLMAHEMDLGFAVYVKVRVEGGELYVCNVHGKSRPVEKLDTPGRLAFSKGLIDFFADKDAPVVIGGDFNLLPETDSVRMFERAGYRDLIRGFDIDTTRNRLVWDRYPVKMYYSDYVFLSDKVQLVDFSVPKNEVSDHLPMLLQINTHTQETLLEHIDYSLTPTKIDESASSIS